MTTATERRTLAVETDTALAALYEQVAKVQQSLAWKMDELHRQAGDEKQHRFSGPWRMTENEVLDFDASALPEWAQRSFAKALAEYEEATTKLGGLYAEIRVLDQVWRDNGMWHRYFLVTNTNGHVHRDQSCSTCFPTTQYAWLVDLADCDEEQMVADYGELACTVCFPNAPSFKGFGDGTSSIARLSQAEKDAKAAAKAAKAAAKEAKAIYSPDGSPLRDDYGVVKTERAASIRLTDLVEYGYHLPDAPRPEKVEVVGRLAEALAHKHGTTVEDEIEAAVVRAKKRR